MADAVITHVTVRDIRFPTSLEAHGSDAMVRSAHAPCELAAARAAPSAKCAS